MDSRWGDVIFWEVDIFIDFFNLRCLGGIIILGWEIMSMRISLEF